MSARKSTAVEALEFLPAALEVLERPASPLGRAVLWAILALLGCALTWSVLGEVDVVAVARGKVIPAGRVKVVQPLETAVVRRILVGEGERVAAGQLLIELDATTPSADRERLEAELDSVRLGIARIDALVAALDRPARAPQLGTPAGAAPVAVALHARRLAREYAAYRAQERELLARERERHAELAATRMRIEQLDATLPLVEEQAQALRLLAERKLAPRLEWLEIERTRIEHVKERSVRAQELGRLESSIASARGARAAYRAGFERDLLAELAALGLRARTLEQELAKVRRRERLGRLTAPVAGVVQALSVHTVGAVVTAAETLVVIVPDGQPLVVEAWVENKDIGFVHVGQAAEVKLDPFPFTKYGTLAGRVAHLSRDALPDERLGLVYRAQVEVEVTHVEVDGERVAVAPGMAAVVEVKTGRRRLIEFLLSPLLRYRDESARER